MNYQYNVLAGPGQFKILTCIYEELAVTLSDD